MLQRFRKNLIRRSKFPKVGISENLLIIISPATVSANLLLLFQRVESSEYFTPIEPPSIIDKIEAIESIPNISGNLFEPVPQPRTFGDRYAKKQTSSMKQQDIFGYTGSQKTPEARKAYRIEKDTKGSAANIIHRLTIWDLIYPILLPPLNVDLVKEFDFPSEIYPFQKDGINFLLGNKSALLADEMGTGKTVMSTVATRILFRQGLVKHALIVCPLSVLGNSSGISRTPEGWDGHLKTWAPELEVTVVRGSQNQRYRDWTQPAHVYLTTYDILRQDLLENETVPPDVVNKIDLVILDEAQIIKNPSSGRARAAKKMNPSWRWALTGTPLENRIEELYAVFDFVKPRFIPQNLAYHNIRELVRPYIKRRTKKEVWKDLPPKILQEMWLEMDEAQRKIYQETENVARQELTSLGEKVTRPHIFTQIQKLKRICNFVPGIATSAKNEELVELVEEIQDAGRKVLVFSQWKDEYGVKRIENILKEIKVSYVRFTGDESKTECDRAIEKFKTDPEVTVFLATLQKGGLGITLTEASYVIHFDHWWNPARMWQAEDRAHRHGQKEPVNVYSFWMKETIEERIYNKLKEKGLLFEQVIGVLSEDAIESRISTEEWLELLGVPLKKQIQKAKVPTLSSIEDIYERIQTIDPFLFEKAVQSILQKLGYQADLTPKTRDEGIDIFAKRQSEFGFEITAVQCKRMPSVGREHLQKLLGVVSANRQVSKGLLVTSGDLSKDAKRFCEENSGQLYYWNGSIVAKQLLTLGLSL